MNFPREFMLTQISGRDTGMCRVSRSAGSVKRLPVNRWQIRAGKLGHFGGALRGNRHEVALEFRGATIEHAQVAVLFNRMPPEARRAPAIDDFLGRVIPGPGSAMLDCDEEDRPRRAV